jgi:filamentous hemagglutinin family protein
MLITKLSQMSGIEILVRSISISLGLLSVSTLSASAEITATTGVGSTGTTFATGATPNTIDIKDGQKSSDNKNLFHSFGKFNVDTNQVANFNFKPDAGIQNILGTVTDGASLINGKLQVNGGSTTTAVNLFLMNPAGIVFGKGASLDINGAFTATTAKAIDFNGKWFNAFGTNIYSELTGNPIGLAFGSGTPGSIFSAATFDASPLDPNNPARTQQTAKPGQSITLVGGTVISTGDIKTAGGNISIATVEGGKYVKIKVDGSILGLELPTALPTSANSINSAPTSFKPPSLAELLTNTKVDLAATGVKNENGVVTLVGGNPTAVNALISNRNQQIVIRDQVIREPDQALASFNNDINRFNQFLDDINKKIDAINKEIVAVAGIGDPKIISDAMAAGDTVSKQNRSIFNGDVITTNIDTSNPLNGGNINITSSQAIFSKELRTSSSAPNGITLNQKINSGTVDITAQSEIKTGAIDTSTSRLGRGTTANGTKVDPVANGGNVTLSNQSGDIIVDFIRTDADDKGFGGDFSLIGGNIKVRSTGLFRAITSDFRGRSISTSNNGLIDIKYLGTPLFVSGATFSKPDAIGTISVILQPNFTFPKGAGGIRGALITERQQNGSVAVTYVNGAFVNSVAGYSITADASNDVLPPKPKDPSDQDKNSKGGKDDVAKNTSGDNSEEKDSTKGNSDDQASKPGDSEEDKQKAKKRKQKAKCSNNSSAIASARLRADLTRSGNSINSAAEEPCPPNIDNGILQILTDRN